MSFLCTKTSSLFGAQKFKGMFFILYKCSFGKANKIADICFVCNEDKIVSAINVSAIVYFTYYWLYFLSWVILTPSYPIFALLCFADMFCYFFFLFNLFIYFHCRHKLVSAILCQTLFVSNISY